MLAGGEFILGSRFDIEFLVFCQCPLGGQGRRDDVEQSYISSKTALSPESLASVA